MDLYFYLFIRLLLFSFFCQDANKTGSNCGIIVCNLSKKRKLALYKSQSGEPNYVDHNFLKYFARSYLYNNLRTDIQIL